MHVGQASIRNWVVGWARDERNTTSFDREVTRSWKKKKRFVAGGEAADADSSRFMGAVFEQSFEQRRSSDRVEIGAKSSSFWRRGGCVSLEIRNGCLVR